MENSNFPKKDKKKQKSGPVEGFCSIIRIPQNVFKINRDVLMPKKRQLRRGQFGKAKSKEVEGEIRLLQILVHESCEIERVPRRD